MLEVIGIVHVSVGFPFKEQFAVCVPVKGKSDKPFYDIPEIETHKQGFYHLSGVYLFVSEQVGSHLCSLPADEYAEEVHGLEPLQRKNRIPYYQHFLVVNKNLKKYRESSSQEVR